MCKLNTRVNFTEQGKTRKVYENELPMHAYCQNYFKMERVGIIIWGTVKTGIKIEVYRFILLFGQSSEFLALINMII